MDGAQALAAVIKTDYDLVLMDVQMPNVDGLAATREIRSSLPASRQPVIVGLTAPVTTEYRDICMNAGMNGYLTKPLDRDKLRNVLEELSSQLELRNLTSRVLKISTPSLVRIESGAAAFAHLLEEPRIALNCVICRHFP